MNIAILLLNKGRGSGEVAREHARHLIKKGHKVFFMHPMIGNGIDGAENIEIKLHTSITPVHEYLPAAGDTQKQVARMTHDEMLSYLPDYENALEQIIDDVDVIIGHHANLSAVAVHNVAKKHNKPYVIFAHGTGIEPRHQGLWNDENWKMIKQALEQANGLLVTTDYVRDELIKPIIDVDNDNFLVLPCGVDLHDFHPDNTERIREKYSLSGDYVICPGALTASKGPQNVVEASKKYSDLALTVFIGAGEMEEELRSAAGDRAVFLGFVSAEDKAKLINEATLLVAAPEKKEHFGIIYAEALAGGTPVVAYEGGGVGSIITPTEGILSDRNPEVLGEKIKYLLQNVGQRKQMARSCRYRAEKNYDYNLLVDELLNWLKKVM